MARNHSVILGTSESARIARPENQILFKTFSPVHIEVTYICLGSRGVHGYEP
jgi:hypothetical protein